MTTHEGSMSHESGALTAAGANPASESRAVPVAALGLAASEEMPLRTRRAGRAVAAASVATALAGAGLWWFGTVHPAMDLSGTGLVEWCAGRDTATERDLVTGNVTFLPPHDVELLSILLLDPVNVTIADAEIAPTVAQPGGGGNTPGLSKGWPLTDADRAGYTLDWSAERDFVGARLTAMVEEAPILHLQVEDPTRDASFRAWRVVYRMNGIRWVSTFTHSFRMSGTVGPCSP